MKFILVLLSLHLFKINAFSQKADTIRVYTHTNDKEHWSLSTKNKIDYTLFSADSNSMENISLHASKIADTSVSFTFDTSTVLNKNLINLKIHNDSELSRILKGKSFGLLQNYILPLDENSVGKENVTPKTIYTSYILGDGYGNTIFELKLENTYTIHSRSCLAAASESGKWTMRNNIISLVPNDDDHKILNWFSDDRLLVYTGKYLISKQLGAPENIGGINNVTETYFYFTAINE
jgi:hypothetical protein